MCCYLSLFGVVSTGKCFSSMKFYMAKIGIGTIQTLWSSPVSSVTFLSSAFAHFYTFSKPTCINLSAYVLILCHAVVRSAETSDMYKIFSMVSFRKARTANSPDQKSACGTFHFLTVRSWAEHSITNNVSTYTMKSRNRNLASHCDSRMCRNLLYGVVSLYIFWAKCIICRGNFCIGSRLTGTTRLSAFLFGEAVFISLIKHFRNFTAFFYLSK